MNPLQDPAAEERLHALTGSGRSLLIAVSLLGAAASLAIFNVVLYQYSRLLEYRFQNQLSKVRPWIVPEGTCEIFLLAWLFALIASSIAVFRLRHKLLRYEAGLFAAGALVALVINAYCLVWEAFRF